VGSFKKIWDILSGSERRSLVGLLLMTLFTGILDTLGVASVMPFMAIVSSVELVEASPFLRGIYAYLHPLGVESRADLLFLLGWGTFFLLIFSLFFKALTVRAQLRFSQMREFSISRRLLKCYLDRSYVDLKTCHSADLGKSILSEVGQVINGTLRPLITIVMQLFILVGMIVVLVYVNPRLALFAGGVLSAFYVLILISTRGYLLKIGRERLRRNRERFSAVVEAFASIKDVKANGLEQIFLGRYEEPAKAYAAIQAVGQLVGLLPRFVLEGLAFGGLLLITLYLMHTSGSVVLALPEIALYAFAGYRIMPALQQLYVAITQFRFARPALDALHKNLMEVRHHDLESLGQEGVNTHASPDISLASSLQLRGVNYRYPGAVDPVLKDVSLSIPARTTVAFVGRSGSGKTTLADVILFLLTPSSGYISVDGITICNANLKEWRNIIGYVPQHIYLTDDTVVSNITYGESAADVNWRQLEWAAKAAQIHEFITTELPFGYQTKVGEGGVRLSGGQRQRLGIARALYRKPKLLILDEATSAMDETTEHLVMGSIQELQGETTIIIITHRISTITHCDQVFLIERGGVVASGTFDEVAMRSDIFRVLKEGDIR